MDDWEDLEMITPPTPTQGLGDLTEEECAFMGIVRPRKWISKEEAKKMWPDDE